MAPPIKIFHPENILSLVTSLRTDGLAASFRLGTETRPLSGKQCHIYVVGFPDNTTWAVRIPFHIRHLPSQVITSVMEDEVTVLQRLETCGFSWSPRLLAHNCGFDTPIGFPYLVLSWIEGTPLEWSDTTPIQRESRNKILRQIGDMMLELADCTQEPFPGVTAIEHLTQMIDRKIVRVSNGDLPELQFRDCFVLRALARRVVHPVLDTSPAVLSHEDLAGQNIIIDCDYNIKGIIDWGFARRLPLQFAIGFPRFLSIEPWQISTPAPLDAATFSSALLQPSLVLQTDREYLISHVSSVEQFPSRAEPGASPFAQSMATVLSAPNVDWRRLIIESVSSKGLHKWMVEASWLLNSARSDWIDVQGMSLIEEAEGFVMGVIGKESRLSREILLDGIESKN